MVKGVELGGRAAITVMDLKNGRMVISKKLNKIRARAFFTVLILLCHAYLELHGDRVSVVYSGFLGESIVSEQGIVSYATLVVYADTTRIIWSNIWMDYGREVPIARVCIHNNIVRSCARAVPFVRQGRERLIHVRARIGPSDAYLCCVEIVERHVVEGAISEELGRGDVVAEVCE